jgi:hypothetical protein
VNEEFQNDELTEATMQTIPRANVLGVGVSAINMEDAAFLSDRLLPRCTEIADFGAIFVNAFPRFDCKTTALKSRTGVFKPRTKLRLKFVRNSSAKVTTMRVPLTLSLPLPFSFQPENDGPRSVSVDDGLSGV